MTKGKRRTFSREEGGDRPFRRKNCGGVSPLDAFGHLHAHPPPFPTPHTLLSPRLDIKDESQLSSLLFFFFFFFWWPYKVCRVSPFHAFVYRPSTGDVSLVSPHSPFPIPAAAAAAAMAPTTKEKPKRLG